MIGLSKSVLLFCGFKKTSIAWIIVHLLSMRIKIWYGVNWLELSYTKLFSWLQSAISGIMRISFHANNLESVIRVT